QIGSIEEDNLPQFCIKYIDPEHGNCGAVVRIRDSHLQFDTICFLEKIERLRDEIAFGLRHHKVHLSGISQSSPCRACTFPSRQGFSGQFLLETVPVTTLHVSGSFTVFSWSALSIASDCSI